MPSVSLHRKQDGSIEPRILGPGFNKRVYAVVRGIPRGRVASYGDIAKALGSVSVARHVGFALAALEKSGERDVPWQRVVNSRLRISGTPSSERFRRQYRLLKSEGVELTRSGQVLQGDGANSCLRPPVASA